jgi:hypothetical protein
VIQIRGRSIENTPIAALCRGISTHEEMEGAVIKDQSILPVENAVTRSEMAPLYEAFVITVDEELAPLNMTAAIGHAKGVQENTIIAWEWVQRITTPHGKLQAIEVDAHGTSELVVCNTVRDEEEVVGTSIVYQKMSSSSLRETRMHPPPPLQPQ